MVVKSFTSLAKCRYNKSYFIGIRLYLAMSVADLYLGQDNQD